MNASHPATIFTRLLLCAGLAAACATAGAGVNRCIDGNGAVLLTDTPCADAGMVASEISDGPEAGIAINSGGLPPQGAYAVERIAPGIAPAPAPRSRWADLPRPLPRRAMGADAATLQAAYMNLQVQDEMRRQRRVASLR